MIAINDIGFNVGRQVKLDRDIVFINGVFWHKKDILGAVAGINEYELIKIVPTDFAYSIWSITMMSNFLLCSPLELNYVVETSKEEIINLIKTLEL